MSREFKTPDYEATLHSMVTWREAVPVHHRARLVVEVLTPLEGSPIDAREAPVGGVALAPEIRLGLLGEGSASGVFRARPLERTPSENLPFRLVASGGHPAHDTRAHFRKPLLVQMQEWFVPIRRWAQTAGVCPVGHLRLDGRTLRAEASPPQAVSAKRRLE